MLQSTRSEGNGRGVAIPDAPSWVGTVIVGFDYWQVLSHYPELVTHLIQVHAGAVASPRSWPR